MPEDAKSNRMRKIEEVARQEIHRRIEDEETLRNLRTFPMVQVLEHHRHLRLHGALFRIMDGRLFLLDESTGAFEPVCETAYAAAFAEARF